MQLNTHKQLNCRVFTGRNSGRGFKGSGKKEPIQHLSLLFSSLKHSCFWETVPLERYFLKLVLKGRKLKYKAQRGCRNKALPTLSPLQKFRPPQSRTSTWNYGPALWRTWLPFKTKHENIGLTACNSNVMMVNTKKCLLFQLSFSRSLLSVHFTAEECTWHLPVQYPNRTELPEENRSVTEGLWHMPSQPASGKSPTKIYTILQHKQLLANSCTSINMWKNTT